VIKFLQPWVVAWVLGALVVVFLVKWLVRWRYAASTVVGRISAGRYRASRFRRAPFALLALAIAFIGVALMQPVLPHSTAEVTSRGLEIVIVMDLSSSMQEEIGLTDEQRSRSSSGPHGATRLQATKDAIKSFVRSRTDDRIGLIVFSDNPYVVSPLTFDHQYLLRYIDLVDDQILQGEGQTAIGDGLALANYLLAKQTSGGRNHQVIVLFTDGEYNRGRDPIDVLQESKEAQIRVHVVGVDLDDFSRARPGVMALKATVEKNGGRYFDASSERDLTAASRTIDAIEKSTLTSRVYVEDVPVYQWFIVPALLCFAGAMGLRAVPYFVDQT
jgi:Ca-activated chloride channel family protein